MVLGQAQEVHGVAACGAEAGAEGAVVRSVAAPVEELAPEASAWEAEAVEAAVGRAEVEILRIPKAIVAAVHGG